jgi:hypothetical protein
MPQAPRPPGSRPGGEAADVNESGSEHRLFGTLPPKSQGTPDLADFRFQRAVARLHRLGPRPLYEMLVELGGQQLIRSEIEALIYKYAAIDPAVLRAAGGDRFAPWSPRVVGGAR